MVDIPNAGPVAHGLDWRGECPAHGWVGPVHVSNEDDDEGPGHEAWQAARRDAQEHNNASPEHYEYARSQLLSELCEILDDLIPDMSATMARTDVGVMQMLADVTWKMMAASREDGIPAMVNRVASGMLWMFLTGREHATRGYAAPVTRKSSNPTDIPDFVADIFKEGGHG
jgi:hypothetical protein